MDTLRDLLSRLHCRLCLRRDLLARAFVADEDGVTAVEYGLMVAAIAVAIIGVVFLVGADIAAMFNEIGSRLEERRELLL